MDSQQAKVTSIDALEELRVALVMFCTKGRQSINEVTEEIRRTRQWLQGEARHYWEGQVKKRRRALDQAQQELLSARLSKFRDSKTGQQMAVNKARNALRTAEEKLRTVKKWNQHFDSAVGPLAKKLDSLEHRLVNDLPKGVAFLSQAEKSLEAYAERSVPVVNAPAGGQPEGAVSPAEPTSTEEGG